MQRTRMPKYKKELNKYIRLIKNKIRHYKSTNYEADLASSIKKNNIWKFLNEHSGKKRYKTKYTIRERWRKFDLWRPR